jgi:hypothetical protein
MDASYYSDPELAAAARNKAAQQRRLRRKAEQTRAKMRRAFGDHEMAAAEQRELAAAVAVQVKEAARSDPFMRRLTTPLPGTADTYAVESRRLRETKSPDASFTDFVAGVGAMRLAQRKEAQKGVAGAVQSASAEPQEQQQVQLVLSSASDGSDARSIPPRSTPGVADGPSASPISFPVVASATTAAAATVRKGAGPTRRTSSSAAGPRHHHPVAVEATQQQSSNTAAGASDARSGNPLAALGRIKGLGGVDVTTVTMFRTDQRKPQERALEIAATYAELPPRPGTTVPSALRGMALRSPSRSMTQTPTPTAAPGVITSGLPARIGTPTPVLQQQYRERIYRRSMTAMR